MIILFILLIGGWFLFLSPTELTEAQKRAAAAHAERELYLLRDEMFATAPNSKGQPFNKIVKLFKQTSIPLRLGVGDEVSEEICALYFLAHSSKKRMSLAKSLDWYEYLIDQDKMRSVFVRDVVLPEYVESTMSPSTILRAPSFIKDRLHMWQKDKLAKLYSLFLNKVVPKPDYSATKLPVKTRKNEPIREGLRNSTIETIKIGEQLLASSSKEDFSTLFAQHVEFLTWLIKGDCREQLHSLAKLLNEREAELWPSRLYLAETFACTYETGHSDTKAAQELIALARKQAPTEDKFLLDSKKAVVEAIAASNVLGNLEKAKRMHINSVANSKKVLTKCSAQHKHYNRILLDHLLCLEHMYFSQRMSKNDIDDLLKLFTSIDEKAIPLYDRYLYLMGRGIINEMQLKRVEASKDLDLSAFCAPHSRRGRALAIQYATELLRGLNPIIKSGQRTNGDGRSRLLKD